MNAPETIFTTALLGGVAYAVYLARMGPHQPQEVYQIEPATYERPRNDFKDALLGGLAEGLGATITERRKAGGFLDRVLGALTGNHQGGTSPIIPASEDYARNPQSIGTRLMGDLQRDFGLTRNQAAGVVGNLDHESGGFAHMQEISPTVKGSRGGYGYAQWTGPRRREFEAWAAGQGLEPSSYAANYGFLHHELTNTWEKRAIPRLQRTSSAEDAAVSFMESFLRPGIPHTDSRQRRARRYAGVMV